MLCVCLAMCGVQTYSVTYADSFLTGIDEDDEGFTRAVAKAFLENANRAECVVSGWVSSLLDHLLHMFMQNFPLDGRK